MSKPLVPPGAGNELMAKLLARRAKAENEAAEQTGGDGTAGTFTPPLTPDPYVISTHGGASGGSTPVVGERGGAEDIVPTRWNSRSRPALAPTLSPVAQPQPRSASPPAAIPIFLPGADERDAASGNGAAYGGHSGNGGNAPQVGFGPHMLKKNGSKKQNGSKKRFGGSGAATGPTSTNIGVGAPASGNVNSKPAAIPPQSSGNELSITSASALGSNKGAAVVTTLPTVNEKGRKFDDTEVFDKGGSSSLQVAPWVKQKLPSGIKAYKHSNENDTNKKGPLWTSPPDSDDVRSGKETDVPSEGKEIDVHSGGKETDCGSEGKEIDVVSDVQQYAGPAAWAKKLSTPPSSLRLRIDLQSAPSSETSSVGSNPPSSAKGEDNCPPTNTGTKAARGTPWKPKPSALSLKKMQMLHSPIAPGWDRSGPWPTSGRRQDVPSAVFPDEAPDDEKDENDIGQAPPWDEMAAAQHNPSRVGKDG
eukprot:CAMPEP_0194315982 /NCGR_PEP_ID=MMETSP0171-20130528/12793_1 /TAXON_ID=218684 /ORGANISM="Corethron pennatum, Strain L29A3" /LENGTH=475 /DNA_ID=CAMNT_0039072039 /DNA_START=340 /DNA_END=1764 /DNA_ORIENTATION=+